MEVDAVVTVKFTPLLATPPTVTTTLPVVAPVGTGTPMLVAPQLVGEATVPLNVTVLVPWGEPKFAPVIVIGVPTGPDAWLKLVIVGADVTVKVIPLLFTPPTVTTTFPVVAPAGTGTPMLVAPQLVGEATVPLNVTVLVPWGEPKFAPVMVIGVPTAPVVWLRLVMLGATGPPPAAALNAANPPPQLSEAANVAPAEALPAVAWI